ncbi:RHS repeat domain-containing protein [Alteromonas sp. RKMC-009]|uniref:RHS repeat domain-containing protein n=1 Tax=Alteromonas sp. RKMC-009 TaxID=2267264 RepID=UPI0010C3DC6E|nr:RHS repeat-associated core domain-containing protein [Alteromonas sp. RKMC-009]AYA63451.2 RHS repeat-associated core domain-containing protein [Alteromonas sp. RKMC-009]
MNYSAGYDNFGNLIESMNVITGMTMNYEYDSLHRLEGNTISGWGSSERISYSYDAVGNLLSKSDYAGTYRYGNANRSAGGNAGSNAVRQIVKGNSTVNFLYDNMGNMTSGDGVSLVYNAYRQPVRIVRNGTTFDFTYDANLERVKEVRNGITTYEIDKVFEKSSDGSWSLYIADIAVLKYSNSDGHSIFYRHKDRLGSALTFTDENGNVSGRRAFDPFGKPRAENGSSLSVPRLTFLNDSGQGGRRGFTDHRHLDEAQLIHMNGRVYDYNLGRFMSVDPLIHEGSQGINPYSYIMNNPLAGTDPTGYKPEEKTVTVTKAGSRIKRKVKVSAESNGDGTATLSFSGTNGAAVNAVKNSVVNTLSGASFEVAEIGSQGEIARNDLSSNKNQQVNLTGEESVSLDGGGKLVEDETLPDYPNLPKEEEFWEVVNSARKNLNDTVKFMREKNPGAEYGIAIYRNEDGTYRHGRANTAVPHGYDHGLSKSIHLVEPPLPIKGNNAVLIMLSARKNATRQTILGRSYFYNHLSRETETPVFVKGSYFTNAAYLTFGKDPMLKIQ